MTLSAHNIVEIIALDGMLNLSSRAMLGKFEMNHHIKRSLLKAKGR
jgi:hypothetical protein